MNYRNNFARDLSYSILFFYAHIYTFGMLYSIYISIWSASGHCPLLKANMCHAEGIREGMWDRQYIYSTFLGLHRNFGRLKRYMLKWMDILEGQIGAPEGPEGIILFRGTDRKSVSNPPSWIFQEEVYNKQLEKHPASWQLQAVMHIPLVREGHLDH